MFRYFNVMNPKITNNKEPLELLGDDALVLASECLRVMGHPTRIRIVEVLLQGEFTVGEVARICRLPAHQTTGHLRLMKNAGLLNSKRSGRSVYYSISDPRLPGLINCIRTNCQCNKQNQEI
ncbi:HTH-type transcriptional repressor CzrA [Limihaloglobus sulfuriphilus]|uniref:HTH-type transcriptional repressor CzrA n=1 Tax=Limihaloglobus sulfuriphilus TaxID=1851148 RepID=A0A1Q2MFL5_9BACT|nr:metalloregulator ArsR/SmtB family transcription factor [Limihaloglobus sulfuriphilus]AQQ71460.1 HTH-type transcriptional repressor CzrA [Limihaloglobus sulfuriphilus]